MPEIKPYEIVFTDTNNEVIGKGTLENLDLSVSPTTATLKATVKINGKDVPIDKKLTGPVSSCSAAANVAALTNIIYTLTVVQATTSQLQHVVAGFFVFTNGPVYGTFTGNQPKA